MYIINVNSYFYLFIFSLYIILIKFKSMYLSFHFILIIETFIPMSCFSKICEAPSPSDYFDILELAFFEYLNFENLKMPIWASIFVKKITILFPKMVKFLKNDQFCLKKWLFLSKKIIFVTFYKNYYFCLKIDSQFFSSENVATMFKINYPSGFLVMHNFALYLYQYLKNLGGQLPFKKIISEKTK